jgi:D-psicose/D-tagatose/L-ribulose 3-epimerase
VSFGPAPAGGAGPIEERRALRARQQVTVGVSEEAAGWQEDQEETLMNTPQAHCRFGLHSGLWTFDWTREAAERVVPEAAEFGVEVLEISVGTPERIDPRHSRALCERYGIEPTASLCLPEGAAAALQPDKATAVLLKALETAHALGSEVLTGVTYTVLNWRSGALPTEAEYANIVAALKPVARQAAEWGMSLGLEPCNRYETHLLNTGAQAAALIDRIDAPNVFIHLDSYHMHVEEHGLGAGVRASGDRCRYIHLSESDRGLPGSGNLDWVELFRSLAETGFSGYLVGEVFAPPTPADAAALNIWQGAVSNRFDVLEKGLPFLKALARQHGLL